MVLIAALPLGAVAAAPRVDAALQRESLAPGPQLECVVRLNRGGLPLDGAAATMRSMPMAHHVTPAAARPTGAGAPPVAVSHAH